MFRTSLRARTSQTWEVQVTNQNLGKAFLSDQSFFLNFGEAILEYIIG